MDLLIPQLVECCKLYYSESFDLKKQDLFFCLFCLNKQHFELKSGEMAVDDLM